MTLTLTGGQVNDGVMLKSALESLNIKGSTVLADKAYGSIDNRTYLTDQNADYCIPPKSNMKEPWEAVLEDEHLSSIEYRINKRPSSLKITDSYTGYNWDKEIEHRKSSVRCKIEHAFLIVKRDFGYRKTVYRGIAKNLNRFHVLFGCANLLMCIRAGRTETFKKGKLCPSCG